MVHFLSWFCAFCSCISICAQAPRLVLPIGHTDKIFEAHFSADGKKVVTAGKDKSAKIWDASTGYLLTNLNQLDAPVRKAMFSPNGNLVLTYSYDVNAPIESEHAYTIWSVATGIKLAKLAGPFAYEANLTFSPDSRFIITYTDTAKLWDVATGKLVKVLLQNNQLAAKPLYSKSGAWLGTTNDIISLQYSPDGQWIAAAINNRTIALWQAATGKWIRQLTGLTAPVMAMQFAPDGKSLQVVTSNETMVWNSQNWTVLKKTTGTITGDAAWLSPNGKLLASIAYAPEKKQAMLWSTDTRKLLIKQRGMADTAHQPFGIKEDQGLTGNIVAVCNNAWVAVLNTAVHNERQIWQENDSKAMLLQANKPGKADTLQGHSDAITYLAFSADGTALVTVSDDGTAKIWNAATGALQADLAGHTFNSRAVSFSPPTTNDLSGGSMLVMASDDGVVNLWETATASRKKNIFKHDTYVFATQFSSNANEVLSAAQDGSMVLSNLSSNTKRVWRQISEVRIDPTSEIDMDNVTNLVAPVLSPDGNLLLEAIQSNTARVYDTKSGKQLFSLSRLRFPGSAFAAISPAGNSMIVGWRNYDHEPDKIDKNAIAFSTANFAKLYEADMAAAAFSSDGLRVVTTAIYSERAPVRNATTGEVLFNIACGDCGGLYLPKFSPDNLQIFAAGYNGGNSYLFDGNNGKLLHALADTGGVRISTFSADGKKLAIANGLQQLKVWDTRTGAMLFQLVGHSGNINTVTFNPNNETIVTTATDNYAKVWDAATGKNLYSFFAIDSTDYIVLIDGGYYMGSRQASRRLHYVTDNFKAVSFEQLDVQYNRPDLVLAAMGNKDSNLIATYRQAYVKRMKNLGIDTGAFNRGFQVPEADILNRDSISIQQKSNTLRLHIVGSDAATALRRYNVWVNEVPVYGSRGKSLEEENIRRLDVVENLPLSNGGNRIAVGVINANGAESYRLPLMVNNTVNTTPANTYFIGIGVDEYANSSKNLRYSVKDIRDLSAALQKKFGNRLIVDTLFNKAVTVANVQAIKQLLMQTTVNDRVIVSFSGHGLLSKNFDYYLATHAINFDNPEENGLSYAALENLLDSIPSRQKLLLIDACHSGEVDKSDLVRINSVADSMQLTRGTTIVASKEKSLGLKNSFELMQQLFLDVGKSTGATIIAAAAGTQFALEKNELQNGVFTYCLLQAMQQYPTMAVSDLKRIVGANVLALTKGLQQPTARNESIYANWQVW